MLKITPIRYLALAIALSSATGWAIANSKPTQTPSVEVNIQQQAVVTLSGVVIKKPWAKNAESWMAGGGDYYVLDVGDAEIAERSAQEGVILRASEEIDMEQFEEYVDKRVEVEGEYVVAQPYVPESPMESYPTDLDGKPLPRGAGFKVHRIAVLE